MKTFFILIALFVPILPNLWGIWHALRHDFPTPAEQTAWVRIAVFIPVLGGIAYLLIGRRRAIPRPGDNPANTV